MAIRIGLVLRIEEYFDLAASVPSAFSPAHQPPLVPSASSQGWFGAGLWPLAITITWTAPSYRMKKGEEGAAFFCSAIL